MAKKSDDLSSILAPLPQIVGRLKQRRQKLEASRQLIDTEIDAIDAQIVRLSDGTNVEKPKRKAQGAKGFATRTGRRIRRSREQLDIAAKKVVAFISKSGKEGVSGRELKAEFGPLMPSANHWLKQYAPDSKIKTTGVKAKMRYHVG